MLRKIKKYKINLRPSYIARAAKKKLELKEADEALEQSAHEAILEAEKFIVPTALYETFSKTDTPPTLQPLWATAGNKTLSLSIIATTVGPKIEEALQRIAEDPRKAVFLEAAAQESLEQSTTFIVKLLTEEAKEDHCELSPLWPAEVQLAPHILETLEASKADLHLNGGEQISPLYSRISFCFWNPLSKK